MRRHSGLSSKLIAVSSLIPIKPTKQAEKLDTRLQHLVGQAIADFTMIEEGDKVMVCLSGGKDSYGLLDVLLHLQHKAPIHFELIAVNLDQKQPGFPEHVLPDYLTKRNVPFHIEQQDTYSIVTQTVPEGKTTCGLCSRLRRGILYRVASELQATKIALGHHRDDILETFFLNLFFGGTLQTMPPTLLSDDRQHIVIRPLTYVKERDLAELAQQKQFPIIPCDLCGSQEHLKRQEVKAMLQNWEQQFPGRVESTFAALSNISPSHLLDSRHFNFSSLKPDSNHLNSRTA